MALQGLLTIDKDGAGGKFQWVCLSERDGHMDGKIPEDMIYCEQMAQMVHWI